MDLGKRLEALRRLLEQRQPKAQVEEEVEQPKLADSSETSSIETPESKNLLLFDPTVTPPRLRGLSYDEVALLEIDGELSEQEKLWLATKTPPGRLPDIRYLSMLGELKKVKGEQG